MNGQCRARFYAKLTLDAANFAGCHDPGLHGIAIGTQRYGSLPGPRDAQKDVLGADVDTLAASRAFSDIYVRQAVLAEVQSVERTDPCAIAEADTGPLTEFCPADGDFSGTARVNAGVISLAYRLVVGPTAGKNCNLVNSRGCKPKKSRDLVACFLAARCATIGGRRVVSGGCGICIAARKTACSTVCSRKNGPYLIYEWIGRDSKFLAEKSKGYTDEKPKDRGKKRRFKNDLHERLT